MGNTSLMVSNFPYLTVDEFHGGCEVLQRRCEDRLEDTDCFSVRWQHDALMINKTYVHTSACPDGNTHIPSLEESGCDLQNDSGEDEVGGQVIR